MEISSEMKNIDFNDELFQPDTTTFGDSENIVRPSISYWKDAWRRFRQNKVALMAVVILFMLILMSIFVPTFSKYTYSEQDLDLINSPPSNAHIFGTDDLGRDIWVRCWEGARVSLFIAFVVAIINGLIGIVYGGIAGYIGGRLDNLMMRFCEVITSVPQMLWIILLILIMRPGVFPVIIAISATGWVFMARLFRGQVLQLREMEFVMASKILGGGNRWIIAKHLLPNAMSPIITNMAFIIPRAIFAEAFLSYIGLGLPLPMASWGVLASEGASKLLIFPNQLLFPAALICLAILSFNLIGDGLRDALDPKLRS